MAVTIEQIELVNALLTMLERVNNLEGKSVVTNTMAGSAREVITEQLEIYFPPPPPPE